LHLSAYILDPLLARTALPQVRALVERGMDLPEDKLAELRERRAATPDADWGNAEEWVSRALELIKPGSVLSVVLPDGKPFTARRPDDAETPPSSA
jgi:hypothetical protein